MLHVYEFEVFKDEDVYLAFPFDLEGGTQGETFEEAVRLACDWLKIEMEHREVHGLPIPKASFRNIPQNGGVIVTLGVEAGKDTVERVTSAKAAKMLNVSKGRISQLASANKLESFKDCGTTYITIASIKQRLRKHPQAGRPKQALSI